LKLKLTDEEQAMLAGQAGLGVQKAMEIVVALGQIYGAADLVPVESAQVSGVSYKNLGDAGLAFLQEWAALGARARVPAMLNPAGMDLRAWRKLGFTKQFAQRQKAVIAAYRALGIAPTCTCTPYLVGHVPRFGEHVAWAESSAVAYANSVLGARTNREGGPSALAAAITGRTARYGLHLDGNRQATMIVDVQCFIKSEADLGALGYMIGQDAGNAVPYVRFIDAGLHIFKARVASLKTLGAAMAASGAVALFHVEGYTPGSESKDVFGHVTRHVMIGGLAAGYRELDGTAEQIDVVSLGCPHASLRELQEIARYLDGKQVKAALWVTTARATHKEARKEGLLRRIEAAGGRVVADTCMVVAPVGDLGFRTMATNSAKMAFYTPSHSGLSVRFGPTEQCLEAAVTGRWPTGR
jgi:predicted aconitase